MVYTCRRSCKLIYTRKNFCSFSLRNSVAMIIYVHTSRCIVFGAGKSEFLCEYLRQSECGLKAYNNFFFYSSFLLFFLRSQLKEHRKNVYTKTQEHSFVVWSTGERVNDCEKEKERRKSNNRAKEQEWICMHTKIVIISCGMPQNETKRNK